MNPSVRLFALIPKHYHVSLYKIFAVDRCDRSVYNRWYLIKQSFGKLDVTSPDVWFADETDDMHVKFPPLNIKWYDVREMHVS